MSRRVVIVSIGIVAFMAVCVAQTRDGTINQLDVLKDQYAKAVEKAQMEYGSTLVDLRKKYVAALDALMQSMTKRGDLDGALAVRAEKNKEPEKAEAVVEKESFRSLRQPMQVNCFVAADDDYVMCINGVEVARGVAWSSEAFHVSLEAGDTLTVKVTDRGMAYGFGCVIRREGEKDIITSVRDWKAYLPNDKDKWWVIDEKTVVQSPGSGTNGNVGDSVKRLCGVGCENIWSATPSAVAYLMFRVK